MLTRHVADAPAGEATCRPQATGACIRPLTAADLPSVTAQDAHVFGGHRRTVLEWMMDGAPQLCMGCARHRGGPGTASAGPACCSIRSVR